MIRVNILHNAPRRASIFLLLGAAIVPIPAQQAATDPLFELRFFVGEIYGRRIAASSYVDDSGDRG